MAAVNTREISQGGDHQAPANIINVERFSSLGGILPIFFSGNGTPLPGRTESLAPRGLTRVFFSDDGSTASRA